MSEKDFISLARKWRPRRLADIVGQEYIVQALRHAIQQNCLHHAFLFGGTRGIGKTTLARILALLVNCSSRSESEGEPCLQCHNCKSILQGRCPDVIEIDAASHTQVDKIRELLEGVNYAPVQALCKIYIIDEVHMLSKSAFNAMLKTLEEPPAHVKFILATTDPQKLPATIRSRCLCFDLRPLPQSKITQHLQCILQTENRYFENTALTIIARLANGSLRDALSILDQALLHSKDELTAADVRHITGDIESTLLKETFIAVLSKDAAEIHKITNTHHQKNNDFSQILLRMSGLLHRAMLAKQITTLSQDDEDTIAQTLATALSDEELQVLYEITIRTRSQIHLAPSTETGFEVGLLRMTLFISGAPSSPPISTPPASTSPTSTPPASTPPTSTPPTSTPPTSTPPTSTPSSSKEDIQRWEETNRMLTPTAQSLGAYCTPEYFDDHYIRLRLDHNKESSHHLLLDKLKKELQNHFGKHFQVELITSKDNEAQKRKQEKLVNYALQSNFFIQSKQIWPQASLIENSIQFINSENHYE